MREFLRSAAAVGAVVVVVICMAIIYAFNLDPEDEDAFY